MAQVGFEPTELLTAAALRSADARLPCSVAGSKPGWSAVAYRAVLSVPRVGFESATARRPTLRVGARAEPLRQLAYLGVSSPGWS